MPSKIYRPNACNRLHCVSHLTVSSNKSGYFPSIEHERQLRIRRKKEKKSSHNTLNVILVREGSVVVSEALWCYEEVMCVSPKCEKMKRNVLWHDV